MTAKRAPRTRPARRAGRAENRPDAAGTASAPSRDLLLAAGLTLLAWLHRLFFLASNRDRDWPFTIFYEGDSETFFRFARSLLAGKLYDNGIPYHPPGFALLLAGVHSFLGAGAEAHEVPQLAVKATLALLSSLSIGLLYLLVRPYLGRQVALLAALLATYHFGLYVLAVAPVTEGLYLTLLLAALLLWSRRFRHPLAAPRAEGEARGGRARGGAPMGRLSDLEGSGRPRGAAPTAGWKGAAFLGVLFGAMALTRAESVLVSGLLLGIGLLGAWRERGEEGWKAFRPWAIAALAMILTIAPWTIRNAQRLGALNASLGSQLAEPLPTFVPLTIYGPLNLAFANNATANGTFSRAALPSQAGSDVLTLADPQHLHWVLHGKAIAWDWIRHHPGDFLRLVGKKWTLFFSAWKLGWTQWDLPGGLRGTRQPVDVFTPDSWLAGALMAPFALLGLLYGLAIPGGPRRWTVLTLLLLACGLLTTGLFFGYVRQGLLVLPFTLLWVATGLVWMVDRVRRQYAKAGEGADGVDVGAAWSRTLHEAALGRGARYAALGVVVALAVVELIGAQGNRNYRATGDTIAGQRFLNRDAPVRLEVMRE